MLFIIALTCTGFSAILTVFRYTHQIIMGDFNMSKVYHKSLLDSASLFVLTLNYTLHNIHIHDTWIDLLIVSSPDHVLSHGQLSYPCFSRHDMILLSYIQHIRNFSRLKCDELLHNTASTNW